MKIKLSRSRLSGVGLGLVLALGALVLVQASLASDDVMETGKLMYSAKFNWGKSAAPNHTTVVNVGQKSHATLSQFKVEVRQSSGGAIARISSSRGVEALCRQRDLGGMSAVGEYKELEFDCGSASWGALSTQIVVKMDRTRGQIQVGSWLSGYQNAPLQTLEWNPGVAPRTMHLMVFSR